MAPRQPLTPSELDAQMESLAGPAAVREPDLILVNSQDHPSSLPQHCNAAPLYPLSSRQITGIPGS